MNNIDMFLQKMTTQAAISAGEKPETKKQMEKIYLAVPENQGSYQIIPFNDPVSEYPYVTLFDTKEVNIPYVDEKEGEKKNWKKILPKDAYSIKDSTGRVVSSLTAEEEKLYDTVVNLWNELKSCLGGFKKKTERTKEEDDLRAYHIREKNYTIFNAYCVARLGNNNRGKSREKFSALFVIPAKGFMDVVNRNVSETTQIQYGGDSTWINSIYNDDFEKRGGSIVFSVTRPAAQYQLTAQHSLSNSPIMIDINDDDKDYMMRSPIENFLGKAANEDLEHDPSQRRLFNKKYYEDLAQHLSNVIATVKAVSSVSTQQAISITNQAAMNGVNANPIQGSKDPVLAAYAQNTNPTVDPSRVAINNNDPFSNPPVSHMDPISGVPTPFGGSAPFTAPGNLIANNINSDDMPF